MLEPQTKNFGLVGWCWPVAPGTIRFGHPPLKSRRGFEEHMSEFGPKYPSKQHRAGEDEQTEEQRCPPRGACRLQHGPDQPEGHCREKREDEQIRAHNAVLWITLRNNVDPNEEPEPVTANANHQRAYMPQ